MNNYLITLFKDENTVILPGLGALTVVNRSTNELMFMSFLKHNDGTLVKYIAQQEGIDTDLAKEKVEKYIEEIHSVLNNGGVFEIDQIGSFSKDASGEIQFTQSVSEKPVVEQFEKIIEEPVKEVITKVEQEIVSVVEEVEKEIEDVSPEIVEVVEESIVIAEEQEEIQPVIEESEELIAEVEAEIPVVEEIIEEVGTKAESIVAATEEDQWNDDLDLPPLSYKAERPKKPILEKTKKDKKPRKTGTFLILLLAVIIFGGATYVGMNYNELKEKIPFLASKSEEVNEEVDELDEEIVEQEEIEEEPEVIEEAQEEIEDSEPIQEIAPEPVQKVVEKSKPIVSSTGLRMDKMLPIQIIVGSFGDESNATRFVEKLKSQGLPAEIIGVYGGLHTVSAASFSSMDEYKANLSQLQSAGKYWIKK